MVRMLQEIFHEQCKHGHSHFVSHTRALFTYGQYTFYRVWANSFCVLCQPPVPVSRTSHRVTRTYRVFALSSHGHNNIVRGPVCIYIYVSVEGIITLHTSRPCTLVRRVVVRGLKEVDVRA